MNAKIGVHRDDPEFSYRFISDDVYAVFTGMSGVEDLERPNQGQNAVRGYQDGSTQNVGCVGLLNRPGGLLSGNYGR